MPDKRAHRGSHPDPDRALSDSDTLIATADSAVLDASPRWLNLAREVVTRRIPQARSVDLRDDEGLHVKLE